MNQQDIQHRNTVLRAYFAGRDWDNNSEYALKRQLVLASHQLLPNYPYVIQDEWEVEPGRTDKGRGDLVFTDGEGSFAVVEVKWIDLAGVGRSGSTKRTSNRKKRRTVEEQAVNYANMYLHLATQKQSAVKRIEAFIYTNERDRPCLLHSQQVEFLCQA